MKVNNLCGKPHFVLSVVGEEFMTKVGDHTRYLVPIVKKKLIIGISSSVLVYSFTTLNSQSE